MISLIREWGAANGDIDYIIRFINTNTDFFILHLPGGVGGDGDLRNLYIR